MCRDELSLEQVHVLLVVVILKNWIVVCLVSSVGVC